MLARILKYRRIPARCSSRRLAGLLRQGGRSYGGTFHYQDADGLTRGWPGRSVPRLPPKPVLATPARLLGSVFKDHRVLDHGGVIRRHELTDQKWELLAPLIPRAATGRPRVSDRQVIDGMVYKIRTGISWRDLPERYGPWQTVYTRFRRYALDGVFTRALQQLQACADAVGDIDWLVQIDSTIVRAHQHAAATGRKGGPTGRTNRTITPSADPGVD